MIWWVLLLFFAGMVLAMAEFLVPGGICGTLGVVLVIGSASLGVYAYPAHAFPIIILEAVGAALCIFLGIQVISKTGAAKGLTLDLAQRAEDGYVNLPTDASLIGATGEVYTALRPAGTITANGCRIDAVSDGTFIDKGARVKITEVYGNRVVVEAIETE